MVPVLALHSKQAEYPDIWLQQQAYRELKFLIASKQEHPLLHRLVLGRSASEVTLGERLPMSHKVRGYATRYIIAHRLND